MCSGTRALLLVSVSKASPASTHYCLLWLPRRAGELGVKSQRTLVTRHFIHYCSLLPWGRAGIALTATPCPWRCQHKLVLFHSSGYKSAFVSSQNVFSVTHKHMWLLTSKTHLLTVWSISSAPSVLPWGQLAGWCPDDHIRTCCCLHH